MTCYKWYKGNPPSGDERPWLLAEFEMEGAEDTSTGDTDLGWWKLWVRSAGKSAGDFLSLKLTAHTYALVKANYWFSWSLKHQKFVGGKSKDLQLLRDSRPAEFAVIKDVLERYTKGSRELADIGRRNTQLRIQTGHELSAKHAVYPNALNVYGFSPLIRGLNHIHFLVPVHRESPISCRHQPPIFKIGAVPPLGDEHPENPKWLAATKRCKRGHLAPRLKLDGSCVECNRARARKYMQKLRAKQSGGDLL